MTNFIFKDLVCKRLYLENMCNTVVGGTVVYLWKIKLMRRTKSEFGCLNKWFRAKQGKQYISVDFIIITIIIIIKQRKWQKFREKSELEH